MMTRNAWFLIARVVPTLLVALTAGYAFLGVRQLMGRLAGPSQPRLSAVSDNFDPTPVDLLAALVQEGSWAFPDAYWTLRKVQLTSSAGDDYWRQLATRASAFRTFDPQRHFDGFVRPIGDYADASLQFGNICVYQIFNATAHIGVVTKRLKGEERVIGGALLLPPSRRGVTAVELLPNPLVGPQPSTLAPAQGQLIAARIDATGQVLAEIRVAEGEPSPDAKMAAPTLQGSNYVWRLASGRRHYSFVVASQALTRVGKGSSDDEK